MSEPEQVTIRNSVPNILANEAYGPDWKRAQDVMAVHTPGGTSTHLALKSALATTLCGQQAAYVSGAWFLLSGCKKCSKAALKQGVATITDTNGILIDLASSTEATPPS
jgi:fatty acid/phospholipid biosynthesis enzyme